MKLFRKIFGDPNERVLNKLWPIVEKINSLEKKFESFADEKLKEKTKEFKERLEKGETLDNLLPEAFALVRESAKRTIGQRHFDVQLIGGMVLHQGKIAEMKTGEGKTLAATLAVYLNALEGKGVHVVTVNDYLAKRDVNWMGPIYHLLGLSCACLTHEKAYLYEPKVIDKNEVTIEMENLKEISRKEAYLADITYGTNNEFGFDYLRDNLAQSLDQIVQRDLHYAIVDEIDSILIDEARTPLIISVPDTAATKMYEEFARLVPRLKENIDYNVDEKMRVVTLTEEGINKVEKWLGMKNIYEEGGVRYLHYLEQALRAEVLFKKDRDYVVKNGEVIIVDEFTGRLMFGRRYSGGLHQAIEAKEGVRVQAESRTLATITFQNYFRMYKKLAGMTGTALSSAEEFAKVYNLDVVVIPTHRPMIRVDLPDKIYQTEGEKFKAVVEEIKKRHQKGQPVLVGTVSIEKNELLSRMLKKESIPHQVLNAKNHEKEAQIIAQAGRKGAVTVATNMAGRGVDIILGGRPDEREKEEWQKEHNQVIKLGGLHVIGTERHEARRIDDQLRGRAGRQGDPGSSQFFVSLEDDLMRIFGGEKIKAMMEKLKVPAGQPIENKFISKAIESAQAKVEGLNFDLRKHILEYDEVLNKQREKIYQQRREILKSKDVSSQIWQMIEDEIQKIVEFHTQDPQIENWRYEEIAEVVKSMLGIPLNIHQEILRFDNPEEIIKWLINLAKKTYQEKEREIGPEAMRQVERFLWLRAIDSLWVDYLENIEYLRDSVRLRAYGQRDPLIEYKNEAHRLFGKLLENIQSTVVNLIYKIRPVSPSDEETLVIESKPKTQMKVGRNSPCPCGSGKKYKKCCWPKYGH